MDDCQHSLIDQLFWCPNSFHHQFIKTHCKFQDLEKSRTKIFELIPQQRTNQDSLHRHEDRIGSSNSIFGSSNPIQGRSQIQVCHLQPPGSSRSSRSGVTRIPNVGKTLQHNFRGGGYKQWGNFPSFFLLNLSLNYVLS